MSTPTTVILAGGMGTRLAEYTDHIPKPMVEVGHRPLLWHIMKHLSSHGLDDFVVALGHKGDVIKRYIADYPMLRSDFSVNMRTGRVQEHDTTGEDWTVRLVDTGQETGTGGRLRRLKSQLGDDPFLMVYGDGVSNVDIHALREFHRAHGRLVTVTAVRPPARFGALDLDGDCVRTFQEKPVHGEGWISGGYFMIEPAALDTIDEDATFWEREPLERLAQDGQLMAFRHEGYWQCMDNVRDLRLLRDLWDRGDAPWRTW